MNLQALIQLILFFSPAIIMIPGINYIVYTFSVWNYNEQEFA